MTSFLALYRGRSVASAELVTVSSDPEMVARFAAEMLDGIRQREPIDSDPVAAALADGEERALQLVRDEARESRPAVEVEP